MENGKDILESLKAKGNPYGVPGGYFDSLKERLSKIPSAEGVPSITQETETRETPSVTLWQKIKPLVAIAAAFLIMVTAGTALLRKATPSSSEHDEIIANYTYVAPYTDPYAIYDEESSDENAPTDEDLIEYLISTGVSTEHIEYIANNEK